MVDTNVFTGISSCTFDSLTLYRSGAYQDLNVILNGLGGGGGGAVSSATLPLSISNGVLSINLSSYSDTAAMTAYITTALASYVTSAGVNTLLANYVLASAMANYSTTTQVNSAIATALTSYTDTTSLNSLLATKLDGLTVTAPLAVSGTGTSRALTTLWKPSQVTLGTGLFGLASEIGRAHV